MVVVAIIGVLATIAVPQFNKWVVKAKRAEAKSLLSTYYTAMKGFHIQYYASNFRAIGFKPEGEFRFSLMTDNDGGSTTNNCWIGNDIPEIPIANRHSNRDGVFLRTYCDNTSDCSVSYRGYDSGLRTHGRCFLQAFNAVAYTDLDNKGIGAGDTTGDKLDAWGINHNKNLYHNKNDFE